MSFLSGLCDREHACKFGKLCPFFLSGLCDRERCDARRCKVLGFLSGLCDRELLVSFGISSF